MCQKRKKRRKKREIKTNINELCVIWATCFTAHPEHTQMLLLIVLQQCALVDRADTKLLLDGRDERGALVDGSSELLKSLRECLSRCGAVATNDSNVLFTSRLLRLDQSGRTVNAYQEIA